MVYLLYGEDNYIKNEYLKKIKKKFAELKLGINYIQIDINSVQNLLQDIESPCFGYDSKLIVSKNCTLLKKKNSYGDMLAEYLKENEIEGLELVIIEDEIDKTSNLYKIIEKNGKVVECKEKTARELIMQIKNISKMYEVDIKENVAQYFLECVGSNMEDIINELRKLIEYAGKGNEITKEDIDSLTVKKIESVIFDLTDNLGRKNIKEALNVLDNLIYTKEPAQRILIMLYNHFKKLYLVKISDGVNLESILKLKPNQVFLISKYKNQASFFKEAELRTILEEFINLDEQSKKGNIDLEVGLKSVLCRYIA